MTAQRAFKPGFKPGSSNRKALLAKSSIAVKELGMPDDQFRDILDYRYGVRSRAGLKDSQLVDLVEFFKAKGWKQKKTNRTKPQADHPMAKKVRALWLSCWHLGITHTPDEEAIEAFVKRQTKIERLHWLRDPFDALKAIEALKKIAAREAGVDWSSYRHPDGPYQNPAFRVFEAQIQIMRKDQMIAVEEVWISIVGADANPQPLTHGSEDINPIIEAFGAVIRAAKAKARNDA